MSAADIYHTLTFALTPEAATLIAEALEEKLGDLDFKHPVFDEVLTAYRRFNQVAEATDAA